MLRRGRSRLATTAGVAPPPLSPTTVAKNTVSAFVRVSKSQVQGQGDGFLHKVLGGSVNLATPRKRKATTGAVDERPARWDGDQFFNKQDGDFQILPTPPSKKACLRTGATLRSARHRVTSTLEHKSERDCGRSTSHGRDGVSKQEASHSTLKTNTKNCHGLDDVDTGQQTTADHVGIPASACESSLPPHLAQLARLNRCLLHTVTMQMAHTSCNAPIDLTNITPHVARSWGKRQVTTEDIRRCLAMQFIRKHGNDDGVTAAPLILSDYGRGKICIELAPGCDAKAINIERLFTQFEENLHVFHSERVVDSMSDVDIPIAHLSLADLPQAAIADVSATRKGGPLLSKGQLALAELKRDVAARKQENGSSLRAHAPVTQQLSLLDRLREKELAKAERAAGVSATELQRHAALNRVADVAATLSVLSLSNAQSTARQAYTMTAISEKLRDSLRVPISREEGMACVRLIASEVAPAWLRVVTLAGRENVVIQRSGQPVYRVLHERVRELLAG